MPGAEELPINCAARNAVWVYPRVAPPRFPGTATIVETTRSYRMPDIRALHDGADVAVELYGGACALRLDGENNRVYVRRFRYASFASQAEARRGPSSDSGARWSGSGRPRRSRARPRGGWNAKVEGPAVILI